MKYIHILAISLNLLVASATRAQMAIAPDLMSFPVLIKFDESSTGSGFYFGYKTNFYLVTAKHVLYEPSTGKRRYDEAILVSYARGFIEEPKQLVRKLNIKILEETGNVFKHDTTDAVAVRIGKLQDSSVGKKEFVYSPVVFDTISGHWDIVSVDEDAIKLFTNVMISNDVYVFGYPRSIGLREMPQFEYDMPLLRKGVIAGKNHAKRTIVLDCPVYYGNSGGPVSQVEVSGVVTSFRVIGLVSEFIPFVEKWQNTTHGYQNIEVSNSGYSIVTPIDAVIEAIDGGTVIDSNDIRE